MVVAYPISKKLALKEFLQLPETQPASEYLDGKIIQKPMPQGEHSTLQLELASAINKVGKTQKILCAWPELRCTFGDRSLVPDIAVFEWDRIPKKENGRIANKFTIYPDWAIEILSPDQSTTQVIEKILFCLQQGTKLGWLIDSKEESVMIFIPDRTLEIKKGDDILPVLDCLKEWKLSAQEIFSWLIF